MEGQQEGSEASAVEAETAAGFEKLRLGFAFSIASVALFVLGGFFWSSLFVPLSVTYFLGIYERARGWNLLGFKQTETVMWLCAIPLVASPLGWFFLEFLVLPYSNVAFHVAFLAPPALWGIYTAVESNNVRQLEKKFGLELRRGRILALSGVLSYIVVYCFALFPNIYFNFVTYIFISAIFASPFLILSCATFLRRLKPTYASNVGTA